MVEVAKILFHDLLIKIEVLLRPEENLFEFKLILIFNKKCDNDTKVWVDLPSLKVKYCIKMMTFEKISYLAIF